jgi:hypothetical protein
VLLWAFTRIGVSVARAAKAVPAADAAYDASSTEMWGFAIRGVRNLSESGITIDQCARRLSAVGYEATRRSSMAALLTVLTLTYAPISVKTMQMYVCKFIEGRSYLEASDWLELSCIWIDITVCVHCRLTCGYRATGAAT